MADMKPVLTGKEPIAIIGTGCRFPGGADEPSKLWELLKQPKDLLTKVPSDRFNVDGYYSVDGTRHGCTNVRHSYFLKEDTRAFDASFFNINPHEADSVDPQHRLLLETVYEALCSAGLKVEDLRGTPTAVYVGLMSNDYQGLLTRDLDAMPTYTATGTSPCILSNRVSYFFDWHGPSMTIDTACSSSLVAVHHAVQTLRSGDSTVAVAAGANLIYGPLAYIMESKLNMLSPDGRSRMWDAKANGYARGEGVAAITLKTLSQALADGDTIECIIRETGINQDGRSAGITMPNHAAQANLIRDTYAKAGLDLSEAAGRCQYFEAHGTGTPAGDPQEAQAISSAFFGQCQRGSSEDPLYVGSIKTVVGHTEGTAGIAGLIKASLAVQHGIIPPNLLFESLSQRVAPFYKDLRILQEAKPWPQVAPGQPRRASVNSFGFGGTNAHAVIESFDVPPKMQMANANSDASIVPLALSANSDHALRASMENLLRFLRSNPSTSIIDVVWTLLKKRSALTVRRAIPCGTTKEAISALEAQIAALRSHQDTSTKSQHKTRKPNVLGIFTGQGAQWPAMGKKLVESIPFAKHVLDELDQSLASLPQEYRPTWTILEQLALEGDASNVKAAEYSQPLCTAIQIILTKLLAAAGVTITSVVGHSSGEIACAFAAGFITANQAIRIAYLRGLFAKLASAPDGTQGGMLAAGMSVEEANELCSLDMFAGHLVVAAVNAPDSVTFSGDIEAIEQAHVVLEDEGKFARRLRVDKAYHSHHMIPCAKPYAEALEACGCGSGTDPKTAVTWYSSAYKDNVMSATDVNAEYWAHNLVSTVLFSDAITLAAIQHPPFDAAVEVGPHPSLKAPALATMQSCLAGALPYTGCMGRNEDDVQAFSKALGFLWEHFGSGAFDVDALVSRLMPELQPRSLARQLPRYAWDKTKNYWAAESRQVQAFLHPEQAPHPLIGTKSTQSTEGNAQWQSFVRPRDVPWLDGHQLQGQTVLPGATYAVMAMEAAVQMANGRDIQLLEVLDLDINKAVTFDDENSLVELVLSLQMGGHHTSGDDLVLNFTCDSCLAKERTLTRSASGRVVVTFGAYSSQALPPAAEEPPHMSDVDISQFYDMLGKLGYGYSGDFIGLKSVRRIWGQSRGALNIATPWEEDRMRTIHPATLDVAFQAFIGSFCMPGDGRLGSLHLPVSIARIALNLGLSASVHAQGAEVSYNAVCTADNTKGVGGDVEIFSSQDGSTIVQIEQIRFKPFTAPSAADDRVFFAKMAYIPMHPDPILDNQDIRATPSQREIAILCERLVYFYVKRFLGEVTHEDRRVAAPHSQSFIKWTEHVANMAAEGRHYTYQPWWDSDTFETLQAMCEPHAAEIDIRMINRAGSTMLHSVRTDENIFEKMDSDNLLTEVYEKGIGLPQAYVYLRELVKQITARFQNMDILEVGAGTGTATRELLDIPDRTYNSYTFTDISPAFFERASDIYQKHNDRMVYKVLDITTRVGPQGFKEHSYDMVVAANVIHATPSLEKSLKTARSLLKPGGHLLLLEITNHRQFRIGFGFGQFTGWWAGVDEGRTLGPFVSIAQWNDVLQRSGFSPIDTRTADCDADIFAISVFSAHAVEPRINLLHSPLAAPVKESLPVINVVGGVTDPWAGLLAKLRKCLPHRRYRDFARLADLSNASLEPNGTFIVLSELESELFANLDIEGYEGLRTLVQQAKQTIWITENAWEDNPHQAMIIGLIRSLRPEKTDTNMQVIDCEKAQDLDPVFLAEQVLRLEAEQGMSPPGLVWYNEPELRVEGGEVYAPRYQIDTARVQRFNSSLRPITSDFRLNDTPVALIKQHDESFYQVQQDHLPEKHVHSDCVLVRVQYSLPDPIRVGHLGYLYLIEGRLATTGGAVLALADTNGSWCWVRRNHTTALVDTSGQQGSVLLGVAATILADSLLSTVAPGAAALIIEPPAFMTEALRRAATTKGCSISFVDAASRAKHSESGWITLHGNEPRRTLAKQLPPRLAACFNLTKAAPSTTAARILQSLPPTCVAYRREFLFQDCSIVFTSDHGATGSQLLEKALAVSGACHTTPRLIAASDLLSAKAEPSEVIDWSSNDAVPARLQPIDSSDLFYEDKTYWLIGLTGDLGRSLCRWMVLHGARNIVLSSRNPKVDPRWIENMAKSGATVKVLPMDATQRAAVDSAVSEIDSSMPRIGGILFGPLVLQDALLENMDIGTMETVLDPKVKGATNLDKVFSDSKRELDFFVLISSLAMIGGNPGQSAYTASNAFVRALAAKRRKAGLAASVLNLGGVTGVGFIAKAVRDEDYAISQYLFQEMSEIDMHGQFAESIVCGGRSVPTATEQFEVSTGFPWQDPQFAERYPFYEDPRVARFRLPNQRDKFNDTAVMSSGPVKERLQAATCMEDIQQVIRDALLEKLRSALHLSAEDNLDEDLPLIDQGVDSLVAVALRTWFSRQLELDLPVLKVVGGASINDLVTDAAERLPASSVPYVSTSSSEDEVPMPVLSPPADETTIINPMDAILASTSESTPKTSTNDSDSEEGLSSKLESLASPFTDYSTPGNLVETKNPFEATAIHDRVQRQGVMSFGQSRFWLMRHLVTDPTTFNTTGGMWMEGYIDPVRLGKAVDMCARRHEIYRTRFYEEDGRPDRPMQAVMQTTKLRYFDRPVSSKAGALLAFEELERYQYSLDAGDLSQVHYFHWGANESLFVMAFHHIVSDGSSFQGMFNEVNALYNGEKLPPPPQYLDYANRQRSAYEAGDMNDDIAYWEDEYVTIPPVLPLLPVAQSTTRSKALDWNYHSAFLRLPPMLAARIKGRSRKHKADPVHFYLAAFQVLLSRLTGSSDVVIGVNDANRQTLEDLQVMGFFINLLPIRFKYTTSQTFSESINQARDKVRKALLHSSLPFDVLTQRLNIPRSSTHAPLFQAGFDYKQGQAEHGNIGDATMTGVHLSRSRTAWDITLEVMDDSTRDPQIGIKLQTAFYNQEDAMPILQTYLNLLTSFCLNPALRAEEPRLFARTEIDQALQLGKGKSLDVSKHQTIPEAFGRACAASPDRHALRCDTVTLTYHELRQKVNGLVAKLQDHNVQPGAKVVSLQSACTDWVACMLAVMEIGATYVPVDPSLPTERMSVIVDDCQPSAVLVNVPFTTTALPLQSSVPVLDVREVSSSDVLAKAHATPEAACAILYTSGTTGKPKGHLLTHAGVLNNLEGSLKMLGDGPQHMLQQSALTFDMSIWQALMGVTSGGSVYVVPQQLRGDSQQISRHIAEQGITCMVATPLEYASWLDVGFAHLQKASAWRYALTGGESLTHGVLRKFRQLGLPDLRVINSYGPAEVCFYSHAIEVEYMNDTSTNRIPLGFAMPNYTTYIVDEALRSVPAGFTGEILIGGPGVGLGYLNQSDLTTKAFIPNDFATPDEKAGGPMKLFRSGDKGRLRPDGALLFDGRIGGSTQVKLRGIRIELQDIEACILQASNGVLSEAVASVRGEEAARFLVAHVVFAGDASAPNHLRGAYLRQLRSSLPVSGHMRPNICIELDALPTGRHGKVDREALAQLLLPDSAWWAQRSTTSLTDAEASTWQLWCQVLPEQVTSNVVPDAETDFIAVGGNSILIVQLHALIQQQTGRRLALVELFENLTLQEMTEKMEMLRA